MLPSYFNETVTRIRPAIRSERGSNIPDYENGVKDIIAGCHVQPSSTELNQDGRVLGIEETMTLYAPPGSDIRAGDMIKIGCDKYTIMGETKQWKSPTGNLSNVQMKLARWSG